jgi:hypothetical protein
MLRSYIRENPKSSNTNKALSSGWKQQWTSMLQQPDSKPECGHMSERTGDETELQARGQEWNQATKQRLTGAHSSGTCRTSMNKKWTRTEQLQRKNKLLVLRQRIRQRSRWVAHKSNKKTASLNHTRRHLIEEQGNESGSKHRRRNREG